jgi:2-hydroxychromene-2-carboxylate isomerase
MGCNNLVGGDRGMAKVLTKKQQAFVTSLLDPDVKSYSAAYRNAYDCDKMSPRAIRIEASRLHSHPLVTTALDRAADKADRERARTKIAERQAVHRKLWAEVENLDTPSSSRVAALRLLGLEAGMFSEKLEVSEPLPKSDAETLAEIEEILGEVVCEG